MAASVFVGARPGCISISYARVDLKQLQVRALLKSLSRFSEELKSSLPRPICTSFLQRLKDCANPTPTLNDKVFVSSWKYLRLGLLWWLSSSGWCTHLVSGWHIEENFQCAQTLEWISEFSWLMVKWFVWFRVVKWWVTFSAATEVSPWTMLGTSTQLCLCWLPVRSAGSVSVFSHWR